MQGELLTSIPYNWFLNSVGLGVMSGYCLRIIEHVVWSIRAPREKNPHGNLLFALMMLPQSLIFGFALGYLLIALVSPLIQNSTAIEICSYCLPALMAFLATDLREFLQRMTRI